MSAGGRIIFGICAFDAVMRRKKYNFFDGMHETVQFCSYILMDIGRAARFWLFPCCPSEKRGRYFLKKTQNYQLNQWDATDRILREDFNADNAKIDAALAEAKNRGGYFKLKEFTTIADAKQVNLDVSDIDFSLWQNLYVDVHLVGTGSALIRSLESGYGDSQYELNISYSTGNQLCLIPTNAPNAQGNDTRLNFIIRSDASSRIEMQTFSMKPYWGVNTLRCYSDMKTMFFVADGTNSNLQAGSKLTVWGVK